jgi:hypothetical protein
MSSQIPLVSFHRVCLLENQHFGVVDVSFKLFNKRKYIINVENDDTANCIMGLIEKRYQPERGLIKREDNLFIQSDRLLLEDRVISKKSYEWLGMKNDFFYLSGERKSKRFYVDQLKAKNILYHPVYKLKKDDKIKFVLLSLLFQKRGLIIINKLLKTQLTENMKVIFDKILFESHNLICIVNNNHKKSCNIDELRNYKIISVPDTSNFS